MLVGFSPDLEPSSISLVRQGEPPREAPGELLLAFELTFEDLLGTDGRPIELATLEAVALGRARPEACARCPAGGSGPPLLLGPGHVCPIPDWVGATAWHNGGSSEPSAEVTGQARALVSLVVRGACESPLEPLEPTPGANHAFRACPVSPPEAPFVLNELAISGAGSLLGVSTEGAMVATPDGLTTTFEIPVGVPERAAAIPGGDFLVPISMNQRSRYFRILTKERRVEPIDVRVRLAGDILTLPSGEVVIAGANERPALVHCTAELSCEPVPLPSPGDPGCAFLSAGSGIKEALQLEDEVLLRHRRPVGFLHWTVGQPLTCQPAAVAGRDLVELGPMLRVGELLFAAGYESGGERFLVRGALHDKRVGELEELGTVSGIVHGLVRTPSGVLFVGDAESVETSLDGSILRRVPSDSANLLPGLAHGLVTVRSSTGSWQLALDRTGTVFARDADPEFKPRYGSPLAGPEPLQAVARAGDECVGAVGGKLWRFSPHPADCSEASVEVIDDAELDTPRRGFSWAEHAAFVELDERSNAWRVLVWAPGGPVVLLGTVPYSAGEELVDAALLTPDSAALAFSTGRIVRFFADGTNSELRLEKPISAFTGNHGVAWAAGLDSLDRLTLTPSGLRADPWSAALAAVPRDVEVNRRVMAIYALAPDRAWLSVDEISFRASEVSRHPARFEIIPGLGGPELVERTGADPLSAAAAAYELAGAGDRMTAGAGRVLIRGGLDVPLSLVVASLTDCGEVMVVGGESRHASIVFDE
ncbi:MAG: hypothetical protein HYV07_34350 [Deltaproteobacteria bacterium]|nr:hypothetical protein [Deltaproteobacteria bacterium]